MANDISPEPDTIVRFAAATVYARSIRVLDKVVRLTGGHKGQVARVELGYLLVERRWYARGRSS